VVVGVVRKYSSASARYNKGEKAWVHHLNLCLP
jgi:hypothetical protein